MRYLKEVLKRLRKFALYTNQKKCEFFTKEIKFLGYIILTAGVLIDTRRVDTIKEQLTLKNFREVQVFLGFANFYRRFIKRYSKIVALLISLTKGAKNRKKAGLLNQGASEEQAFCAVKDAFTKALILRHFQLEAKIRLETDALQFAILAIMSQLLAKGDSHAQQYPIAFQSQKLNPAKCNYKTYNSELLAIVEGFKQYYYYCEGATHAIQVLTNYNNL